MTTRRSSGMVGALAAAMVFAVLAPVYASAQISERYRVMVTHLVPQNGADDDFGKDLAEELRDLIGEFATHQPVDKDDMEDAADEFDLEMEDLNLHRVDAAGKSEAVAGRLLRNVHRG